MVETKAGSMAATMAGVTAIERVDSRDVWMAA